MSLLVELEDILRGVNTALSFQHPSTGAYKELLEFKYDLVERLDELREECVDELEVPICGCGCDKPAVPELDVDRENLTSKDIESFLNEMFGGDNIKISII